MAVPAGRLGGSSFSLGSSSIGDMDGLVGGALDDVALLVLVLVLVLALVATFLTTFFAAFVFVLALVLDFAIVDFLAAVLRAGFFDELASSPVVMHHSLRVIGSTADLTFHLEAGRKF